MYGILLQNEDDFLLKGNSPKNYDADHLVYWGLVDFTNFKLKTALKTA